MDKERYSHIIDEVYNKYLAYTVEGVKNGFDRIKGYLDGCLVEFDGEYEHFSNPSFEYGYRTHTQEQFINKCKTDSEFSEKWGLKIEERELSLEERFQISDKINKELRQDLYSYMFNNPIYVGDLIYSDDEARHLLLNDLNIPTKKITLEYNNEKIEIYE